MAEWKQNNKEAPPNNKIHDKEGAGLPDGGGFLVQYDASVGPGKGVSALESGILVEM